MRGACRLVVSQDRLGWQEKAVGKVPGLRFRIWPCGATVELIEESFSTRAIRLRALAPAFRAAWENKVLPAASVGYWVGSMTCAFEILTKWFSLTRLETRTKESNVYASIWVWKP